MGPRAESRFPLHPGQPRTSPTNLPPLVSAELCPPCSRLRPRRLREADRPKQPASPRPARPTRAYRFLRLLRLRSSLFPPAGGHGRPAPAQDTSLTCRSEACLHRGKAGCRRLRAPGLFTSSWAPLPPRLPSAHSGSQHAQRSLRLSGPAPPRHVTSPPSVHAYFRPSTFPKEGGGSWGC